MKSIAPGADEPAPAAGSAVLLLPGWQDSGPQHWQTLWQHQYGYRRVEQHDWQQPLRGDWMARLEEVVLASSSPCWLVAHSLGCLLVAHWAGHSRHADRVAGALLVAPPDVERMPLAAQLPGWSPIPLQALPFPTIVVGSNNDPYTAPDRTRHFALAWAAVRCVDAGAHGHLNADSQLGDWPQGHALQNALRPTTEPAVPKPGTEVAAPAPPGRPPGMAAPH